VQITFPNVCARLEQKPLSLPDSALALAACDGSELTALDVAEQDDEEAAAAIVSFASSSSTSTSKRRPKPPTLRARNRRGDRPCTAAVRSDHEIDEVNHIKSYRPIRCNPIVFEHGPERSNRRGSIPLTSTSYTSIMLKSFTKNS